MVNQPTRIPTTSPAVARFLPAAITVGIGESLSQRQQLQSTLLTAFVTVSAIAMNVRSQLMTESRQMDRFFAKYRDPQSEAARQKVFDGAVEDPRKSWFNVLGW